MVRADILCLPVLLQETSLLQRSVPSDWETEEPQRSAKKIPSHSEGQKAALQCGKPSQVWLE
jgi:hypothetical protein